MRGQASLEMTDILGARGASAVEHERYAALRDRGDGR